MKRHVILVRLLAVLVCAALLSPGSRVRAQNLSLPAALRNVGFDQRLNEQAPLDLPFTDEAGREVKLADYFGEKPVILVLAYYRCPMLCNLVLNGVVKGLMDVPFHVGREFNVVTVSFDPRETYDLAAAKKKTYLDRYGRPGAEQGWHFLTGHEPAIEALTKAVGFRYTYDPKSDQYAHASGIVLLTPEGKVSRYFYDVNYSPRDLRLGLIEASQHKIGSPVDQVLLFCFHYDPTAGKYGAAIINLVRAGGVLTVVVLATFLAVMYRHERRQTVIGNPLDEPLTTDH
jgi:protein SCO1/2